MCKKSVQFTFLHLDPEHLQGCPNIPSEPYEDRRPIIQRLLTKFWPDCIALRPQSIAITSDTNQATTTTLAPPQIAPTLPKTEIGKTMINVRSSRAEEKRRSERQMVLNASRTRIWAKREREIDNLTGSRHSSRRHTPAKSSSSNQGKRSVSQSIPAREEEELFYPS